MKRHYIEQRQKLFVQQQQKRLIMQQQKQQQLSLNTRQAIPDNMPNLQSPANAPFPEGMNDLLNNTVAPNVTLQVNNSYFSLRAIVKSIHASFYHIFKDIFNLCSLC